MIDMYVLSFTLVMWVDGLMDGWEVAVVTEVRMLGV